jgi:hypothetical protein
MITRGGCIGLPLLPPTVTRFGHIDSHIDRGVVAWRGAKSEKVGLMRRTLRHFNGHHSIERDPTKRMEFSARKSCVEKRMSISDESVGHQTRWSVGTVMNSYGMEHRPVNSLACPPFALLMLLRTYEGFRC